MQITCTGSKVNYTILPTMCMGRRHGEEVWEGSMGRRYGDEVWEGGMGRRYGKDARGAGIGGGLELYEKEA